MLLHQNIETIYRMKQLKGKFQVNSSGDGDGINTTVSCESSLNPKFNTYQNETKQSKTNEQKKIKYSA